MVNYHYIDELHISIVSYKNSKPVNSGVLSIMEINSSPTRLHYSQVLHYKKLFYVYKTCIKREELTKNQGLNKL